MPQLYAAKFADLFSLHDTLSIIGMAFHNWAEADRFNILNSKSYYNFTIDPSVPLPNLNPTKEYNMKDLVLNRANKILKQIRTEHKKIMFFWSGGVDSTCILSAFIMAGIKPEEYIIFCSQNAIQEYQKGYMILKTKFNANFHVFEWMNITAELDNIRDEYYFVIGWCADQLFGSNLNLIYPNCYRQYWKDGLKYILKDTLKDNVNATDKEINDSIEDFEMYSKRLGLPLKYTCEALWLYNFGIKWSHVSRELKLSLPKRQQRDRVINFFEDIKFQEWSIMHYKEFYKHNQATEPKYYKRQFKDIIYEVFKDQNYLDHKCKVNSWINSSKSILLYPLAIWDADKGIQTYDLFTPAPSELKIDNAIDLQRYNRRRFMLPYLKDDIDKEKYLTKEIW